MMRQPIKEVWPTEKYLILVMCMVGQCITCGLINILGVFTEHFLVSFRVTNAEVAIPSAVAQGLFSAAGPISLLLIRRLGYRICVISTGVISCASFTAASFVYRDFAWMIVLIGVFLGIIANLAVLTTLLILPDYFTKAKERKVAYALTTMGGGVGLIIFPLIVNYFQYFYHWRQALQLLGAISLNLIPLGVALPNRGVLKKQQNLTEPDRERLEKQTSGILPAEKCSSESTSYISDDVYFKQEKQTVPETHFLWRNPLLYMTLAMSLLGCAASAAFYTFVFVCFEQKGLPSSDAAFVLLLMGAISIPGRIVYAIFGPMIKLPSYIQWCMVVCVANCSVACITGFPNDWRIVVIAASFGGVSHGLFWTLHPIVISDIFTQQNFPGMLSLSFLVLGIGGLIGPLIAGWLVDAFKMYSLALSSMGFFASAVFLAPIFAGIYHTYVKKSNFLIE